MRALKAYFLSRLLREKLLLVLFVALGAMMWLSNFSKRTSAALRAYHKATARVKFMTLSRERWSRTSTLARDGSAESAA